MNRRKHFFALFFGVVMVSSFAGAQQAPPPVVVAKIPKKIEMIQEEPVGDSLPANAATPDQIREYFVVTHLDQTLKKVMGDMSAAMRKVSPPYLPASFWADMDLSMRS